MVASVKLSSQGDGGHNMLDGLDESYGQNAGMGNDQAFGEYSGEGGRKNQAQRRSQLPCVGDCL